LKRTSENFRFVGGELGERRKAIEFEVLGAGHFFPIYFRSPEAVLEVSREAFLACALPAMRAGVELELAGEVSARVLTAIPGTQRRACNRLGAGFRSHCGRESDGVLKDRDRC
jgi:hypothetical protein